MYKIRSNYLCNPIIESREERKKNNQNYDFLNFYVYETTRRKELTRRKTKKKHPTLKLKIPVVPFHRLCHSNVVISATSAQK